MGERRAGVRCSAARMKSAAAGDIQSGMEGEAATMARMVASRQDCGQERAGGVHGTVSPASHYAQHLQGPGRRAPPTRKDCKA